MALIEAENCKCCRDLSVEKLYTADSWDHAFDWFCTFNGQHKKIAGYIEWPKEEPKEIPAWCPRRQKSKPKRKKYKKADFTDKKMDVFNEWLR